MAKVPIHTTDAYESTSPFSQAIQHGDTLYLSGAVPVTDEGELVSGDVQTQTGAVFANMQAVLDEADASMADLLKVTVFLTDIDDFADFNETYREHVPEPRPARSAVEVSDLALDCRVEVEAIAAMD